MTSDPRSGRYSRQMLFRPIGPEGQRKLGERSVLIVGMGALGTVLANHMVRAGVGFVRFVDRDYVEASNLQRQMLYDEDDAARSLPKAIAARERLSRINSEVRLEAVVADATADNVEALLDGIDLVLDGTDNFDTRYLLNDACFKRGIPLVYGGAVASRGMSAAFVPGETACLRCLVQPTEGSGDTCDMIGVISPIVDIVASYQSAEALKLLVGDAGARRPTLVTLDIWHNHYYEMKLPASRSDCPVCSGERYPSLENAEPDGVATLCGRETVQIRARSAFDLALWREKLEAVCRVQANPFLLKAELPEGERLVLFPDGRTLVQGTEDSVRAKTLYARYIGL
ncbi:ThiF family adenylyltransferase [Paenibacillus flagellatus]|uniref:Thiamine biosynthesis protein ThiF n=1 Tax=Paenibacillus flagellatus TaxID=2211139 RepID=A0A2V5K6P0_9BACL|nr:ThiF family adenylyltransferase [Paenibacillus flagellatus]PYI55099.1 thiamine biosynthesis protein ThiF [Paenibacillus flagellatus]